MKNHKVINDLFDYSGLKIVQDSTYFKFSLDSLLLFEFLEIKGKDERILDLCTGNAPIPILIANQYRKKVIGMELQKEIYGLGMESIKINHLEDYITIINDDVKNWKNYFPGNNFDVVLCNPPYFKKETDSYINENYQKAVARHELKVSLEDILDIASSNLKEKHSFYMVHIPSRLDEILELCPKYHLAAKKIQFVYTDRKKSAILVLIQFVRNGSCGVKIMPPIFISDYDSYQGLFKGR